ncbi:MAG: hypothetical protein OEY50_03710 [Nitrospinota bacterium]|nr:hypothetical protein [Nitrospinota bacterium]MDH5679690.1 hypothetical protein [Nitrospinota bacterium]
MDLINVKEIERRISEHKKEISQLEQLLVISSAFDGKKATKRSATSPSATKAKPVRGKRAKRGSVSGAIIATLSSSSKPLSAGEVRNILVEQGVVKKGSTTVYAMLSQMTKKGSVKKGKSADGAVYSTSPAKK